MGIRVQTIIARVKARLADEKAHARERFSPGTAIRVIQAVLMAQLAGLLLALAAEPVGLVAFLIGLALFLPLMLRSQADAVHFRFGMIFGSECLLIPIAVSMALQDMNSSIWGIDAGIWLALSIPLGVIMGLSSLFIAIFFFRD